MNGYTAEALDLTSPLNNLGSMVETKLEATPRPDDGMMAMDPSSDPRFNVDPFGPPGVNVNTTVDPGQEDNRATVSMINHVAYNYVALFICALGIFGNLLNIIVLRRPKLKGVMYVYLLGLAVSNLAVLVIAVPAVISLTAHPCTGSYVTAYFHAHLMMPLLNGFMAWSVYIIICMTVNRYISIYMPTYFQRIHTFKNAYVAIFCSFLGGVVLHVPLVFERYVVECDDPTFMADGSMPPPVDNGIIVNSVGSSSVAVAFTTAPNKLLIGNSLYDVYLYLSESLLRLGPIITLTILNILIIVRYNRIARKRQVLKGTSAVHRSMNGSSLHHMKRPSSSLVPNGTANGTNGKGANGTNGSNGNGNMLTVPTHVTSDHGNGSTVSVYQDTMMYQASNVSTTSEAPTVDPEAKTAMTVMESAHSTSTCGLNGVSGGPLHRRAFSLHSARSLSTRGTPKRLSTRRRGLHNPEERMLVVVLIAIVVLFVICTTPAAFLTITITEENKKKVGFSLFRAVSNNLELMGFALNFFVYCLCSADIRRAFVDVLFDNWLVAMIRTKLVKTAANGSAAGTVPNVAPVSPNGFEMTEQNGEANNQIQNRAGVSTPAIERSVVASIHNHKSLNATTV